MTTKIDFTRINNDVNGNPRYVCHFLNFVKKGEETCTYGTALIRAKKIGGRKFHNKQYAKLYGQRHSFAPSSNGDLRFGSSHPEILCYH